MCSIDDPDETIALEAIGGLSRVFELVDEARVSPILVNICHRIRPAFDKGNDNIRTVAFALFGNLWRFGRGRGGDVFFEQIHNNLPALVLHLQDDSPAVQKTCRKALVQLSVLIRSPEIESFLSKIGDDSRALSYEDFVNQLAALLIQAFPDRTNYYVMTCVDYFKSVWNTIRCNAATFVGVMLKNLPHETRKKTTLNPGLVTEALISLLRDKTPTVRIASANAMSLLYSY